MGRYNTIALKADFGERYEECRVASGQTIYPGMLISFNSAGEATVAAPAALASAPIRLVIEDGLIGRTVDTAYVAGELLRYVIPRSGEYYALLLLASEVVVIEDDLVAAANGLFKKTTGSPTKVYARSKEALTASGNQLVMAEIY